MNLESNNLRVASIVELDTKDWILKNPHPEGSEQGGAEVETVMKRYEVS